MLSLCLYRAKLFITEAHCFEIISGVFLGVRTTCSLISYRGWPRITRQTHSHALIPVYKKTSEPKGYVTWTQQSGQNCSRKSKVGSFCRLFFNYYFPGATLWPRDISIQYKQILQTVQNNKLKWTYTKLHFLPKKKRERKAWPSPLLNRWWQVNEISIM